MPSFVSPSTMFRKFTATFVESRMWMTSSVESPLMVEARSPGAGGHCVPGFAGGVPWIVRFALLKTSTGPKQAPRTVMTVAGVEEQLLVQVGAESTAAWTLG